MTITLREDAIALTIAPDRGAEVRSLEVGGSELLYRPPWTPAPLPPGPLAAVPWERSWHGGWQLLWPNAGAACTVDGVEYGFHGAGSVAPFTVMECERERALLRCELDGLCCERGYDVRAGRVRATTRIVNRSKQTIPLVVVEHLILGGPMASEGTTIALDGGRIVAQEWDGTPLPAGGDWPWLEHEDFSILPATTSRFAVVRDIAAGSARIVGSGGTALEVRFDRAAYPHLWLWEERVGATATPWEGRGECLAVEPSSVPSTDGLAGAIARDEAILLPPQGEYTSWLELTPGDLGSEA
jgi:hypothetical protein